MRISMCLFLTAVTILFVVGREAAIGQEDAPATIAPTPALESADAPGDSSDYGVPAGGVPNAPPQSSGSRWSKRTSVDVSLSLVVVIAGTIGVLVALGLVLARAVRKPWLPLGLVGAAVVWISAVSALHGVLNDRAVEQAEKTAGENSLLYDSVISEPYFTDGGFGTREADDFVAKLYKGGTVLMTERDMKTIAAGWGWRMLFWGPVRGDEHGWANDKLLHTRTHHNIWASVLDFTNPPAGVIGVYLVLVAAGAHIMRRRLKKRPAAGSSSDQVDQTQE